LANLKRLSNKQDSVVSVVPPVSDGDIEDRKKHYGILDTTKYAKRYNHLLFTPVQFHWNDKTFQIQYNFCTDPFCKWFGRDQERFEEVLNKPSRYKLTGSTKNRSKVIRCNPDPIQPNVGIVSDISSYPYSNWSIAEEINRLVRIETVQDVEPDYVFHKEGCINEGFTPFDHKKEFYKQGKSTSNSQRWQCKQCKKITNVLPNRKQSTTYHQQRNDILPTFAKLLLNKVPISRACEILDIGVGTYYQKLEWLYRRCLEFLDRYETKPLKDKHFREMWLNTDKMHYLLNNVRKKGQGGSKFQGLEDLNLQTYIVVTSEVFSRYAFRSDVAYDWDITFDELALDTIQYKDDRLNEFAKKNARLDFSHYPQEPPKENEEEYAQYTHDINKIRHRSQYVDGLHVNATYTNIAHYWLIKQLVKANEWRMISDNDSSIKTAFYRVFAKEIKQIRCPSLSKSC
jgi:transposase-like protein